MKFDLGTSCVVLCDVFRKYESFPELILLWNLQLGLYFYIRTATICPPRLRMMFVINKMLCLGI